MRASDARWIGKKHFESVQLLIMDMETLTCISHCGSWVGRRYNPGIDAIIRLSLMSLDAATGASDAFDAVQQLSICAQNMDKN